MHDPDRLESWKEISAFLGRDERTAMRWVKDQGMPIHRAPGLKRGRIFAFRSELLIWMEARADVLNGASTTFQSSVVEKSEVLPPAGLVATSKTFSPWRARRKWKPAVALLSAAVALCIASLFVVHGRTASVLRASGFVRLTDEGHYKRCLRANGNYLYFSEIRGVHERLAVYSRQDQTSRAIDTPFTNVVLQDISSDAQKLLVSSYEGAELSHPLWTIAVDGKDPHRVGELAGRNARWSPNDELIAYSTENTVNVALADGTHTHQIGVYRERPVKLIWSPDGTRLRFLLEDPGSLSTSAWEARFASEDSMAPALVHRLSMSADCCADWTWTADGKYFAYLLSNSQSGPRLVMERERAFWPSWIEPPPSLPVNIGRVLSLIPDSSPQGFYVVASNTERGELLNYSANDQAFETFLPGLSGHYLSFSRDGQWISYARYGDETLWRCKSDGSEPLLLTPPGVTGQLSAWSPDGTQLAFMGKVDAKPWRIFIVSRNGGALAEASLGDDEQGAPTWSPDGRYIVYANVFCQETHTCHIHRIDLRSHHSEILPGSDGLRTARWSPDGNYIAALQPELHQVVLFDLRRQHWQVLTRDTTGDDLNWSHDSEYLYIDSLSRNKPIIDRVRIRDAKRFPIVGISSLEQLSGHFGMWFGLTPNDSPLLARQLESSDIYALDLAGL